MRMSSPRARVLLDTNILICYLLAEDRPTTVVRLVETIISRRFTLLLADELLDELTRKIRNKQFLAERIDASQLTRLTDLLQPISEWTELKGLRHPQIVRDKNDDYLIALASIGRADVLITGDFDLLELDLPLPFRIMNMAEFLAEVEDG
jgi:putative PIN family toxin of toxin-antitoxin system